MDKPLAACRLPVDAESITGRAGDVICGYVGNYDAIDKPSTDCEQVLHYQWSVSYFAAHGAIARKCSRIFVPQFVRKLSG